MKINKTIFEKYKNDDYPPMFYKYEGKKCQILTVGLNPSLTKEAIQIIDNLTNKFDAKKTFKKNSKAIEELINYQFKVKCDTQIPYFKVLNNFFDEIGDINFYDDVFHYDFCPSRETDSKKILPKIKKEDVFFDDLYDLFEKAVIKIDPAIILVLNGGLSRRFIQSKSKKVSEIQPDGYRLFQGRPMILANQLSGGATSIAYKEILIWLVKKGMNKASK